MIRQRVGDLLEIGFEGRWYYVVVLTKIAQFGGNLVFAFHGDGLRQSASDLLSKPRGFNIFVDLLLPKRQGAVERLQRVEDTSAFWLTRYSKATFPVKPGEKARIWYLSSVDEEGNTTEIERFKKIPRKYRSAMDSATHSFDLVASKILSGYTPDKDPRLGN